MIRDLTKSYNKGNIKSQQIKSMLTAEQEQMIEGKLYKT